MSLTNFLLDEQRTYRVVKVGKFRMGWYRNRPMSFSIWAARR